MKRKTLFSMLGLVCMLTLSLAGQAFAEETEFDTEPDGGTAEILGIYPSDYLVEDYADYITLGDLSGLSATRYVQEVTDDMVMDEVEAFLASFASEQDVDRPAEEGDIVHVELTSCVQGTNDAVSDTTWFSVGDEDYGAEFDEKLLGVSKGDNLSFSITYGDETWVDEWVDQTVDFTINVTGVSETVFPEYNDAFIQDNTDFSTTSEYENMIRTSLEEDNASTANGDVVDQLMDQVAAKSEITGYPEQIYDLCKSEMLVFYSMFAGTDDEAEIMDAFGLTEDDIKEEVLYSVNQRLITSAIAFEKGIEVTEDEYMAYLEEGMKYYGYPSVYEFEADNGRESIVWYLYQEKIGDYLLENAEITDAPYEENEEFFELDTESWDDAEDLDAE